MGVVEGGLCYPTARKDESIVQYYHGVKVSDPFRWLEDPESKETKEFVEEQVKLSDSVLKTCEMKDKLKEKLSQMMDYPRYIDAPLKRGDDKYFYSHNTGLQPQDVLYVQGEVLMDPNGLSDDGTVAMNIYLVSEDAKYLAYELSYSGSDWVTIKLLTVHDKTLLETDTLSWAKFTQINWTHDSKGFFYCRFPAPKYGDKSGSGTETDINLYQELYYHFVGTDQSHDILCWADKQHPTYIFTATVTEDGKYLVLYISEGAVTANKVYYCDISEGLESFRRGGNSNLLPFTKLVDTLEATYEVIANDVTLFTFRTNKDAPLYKLVRVDLNEPGSWTDVVPQSDKDVLEKAYAVNGDRLIVCYLSDVKSVLQIRDLETGSYLQQLPIEVGAVKVISARRKDTSAFIAFQSFLFPGIVYQCDFQSGTPELKIYREMTVFVTSKDGTKFPMYIGTKKGIKLDGSHPCLLYGYGGFGINTTPDFKAQRITVAKHLGVVFCIANIRGGGEYGEEWHKAGSLANKQNVFDDFISAAEYLVSAGYTTPKNLCIEGESNGGLLVGACMNQRPDLFGCALAHVGVMDMLRFHLFTIGHAWIAEYGCSENQQQFNWLIKYSPLHNVRRPWEMNPDEAAQYPPTMLLTADHDDRVVPLHTLKLLAVIDRLFHPLLCTGLISYPFLYLMQTLQSVLITSLEKTPQTNPIIGRIDQKSGHGAGLPTQKAIEQAADCYGFMAKMMNVEWTD
ncbi:Prolyl endopeptidase [Linum grandiflorum]